MSRKVLPITSFQGARAEEAYVFRSTVRGTKSNDTAVDRAGVLFADCKPVRFHLLCQCEVRSPACAVFGAVAPRTGCTGFGEASFGFADRTTEQQAT